MARTKIDDLVALVHLSVGSKRCNSTTCVSNININKIQQDATDAGIYVLQNYSICFGCLSHQSSGVYQTVTAASGTGHCLDT